MATATRLLSSRMGNTIETILPKIEASVDGRGVAGMIDLATSENWLIRPELETLYKEAISEGLSSEHLSYPQGLGGDPDLLTALSGFFNHHFRPLKPVIPSQIVTTPGATSCLEALLTTICDEGDSVLVPAPFWNGFDLHFHLRPRVKIVPIRTSFPILSTSSLGNGISNVLSPSMLPELEDAYECASSSTKVRAVVLTNPQNPFGQCYSQSVLQEVLDFCAKHRIHYISDEVYALSEAAPDQGSTVTDSTIKFSSILSLSESVIATPLAQVSRVEPMETLPKISCSESVLEAPTTQQTRKRRREASEDFSEEISKASKKLKMSNGSGPIVRDMPQQPMVHMIWSLSKDFGSSGVRMAVLVSQNPESRPILASVALLSGINLSSLAAIATTRLLKNEKLSELLLLGASRLREMHLLATSRFREWGIPFIAPHAGPYVFVRLGHLAKSIDDEKMAIARLRNAGVLVTPGSAFGGWGSWGRGADVIGWVRITVAVPRGVLVDGLTKIDDLLGFSKRNLEAANNLQVIMRACVCV